MENALHVAAQIGRADIARLLLFCGASIDARTNVSEHAYEVEQDDAVCHCLYLFSRNACAVQASDCICCSWVRFILLHHDASIFCEGGRVPDTGALGLD